jgi:hypothetical protein
MYEDFEPVDLDAVDDDRDLDTDAAIPEREESANPWDRVRPAAGSTASRRGSTPSWGSPPVGRASSGVASTALRAGVVGGAAAAGARAVQRHPKTAVTVGALGAILAATPADQRPAVLKAMGKAFLVVLALGAAIIAIILMAAAHTQPASSYSPPVAPSAPTSTSTCQWAGYC